MFFICSELTELRMRYISNSIKNFFLIDFVKDLSMRFDVFFLVVDRYG